MPHISIRPKASIGFDPVRSALTESEVHTPTVRLRANISNACIPCKRRKRRCLGGQPCPACAPSNTLCHYEVAHDRRRRLFNEQAKAQVRFQKSLLEDLVDGLRGERCNAVLKVVQQSSSLEQIAWELDHLNDLADEHTSSSIDQDLEQAVSPHVAVEEGFPVGLGNANPASINTGQATDGFSVMSSSTSAASGSAMGLSCSP